MGAFGRDCVCDCRRVSPPHQFRVKIRTLVRLGPSLKRQQAADLLPTMGEVGEHLPRLQLGLGDLSLAGEAEPVVAAACLW